MKKDQDKAILLEGLNQAIIGKTSRGKVVYDIESIIEIFIERNSISREEAIEFFDMNVDCLYAGEMSPIFVFKGGGELFC